MLRGDTIAAISSSVGPAARIIVRISGPTAREIANSLAIPGDLPPAYISRHDLTFAGLSIPSWVYVFHSPGSYTGEDLVELHIPGNPLLGSMLLDHLLNSGARTAEPGEFTARAFLNGRMDLSTAEGVAAVISAANDQELQAGRQLMAGELARRLAPILESLARTLALIEVGIDFSQDDVTILPAKEQAARIGAIEAQLVSLLAESSRLARLSHEPRVVLVGKPNAGKSTLLNALAGQDRAVVSPVAGTTRDVLSARIALPSGYVQIFDVAGIEDIDADAVIERQMQSQSQRAIAEADFIVLVQEVTDVSPRIALDRAASMVVRTKADSLAPSSSFFSQEKVGVLTAARDGEACLRLAPQASSQQLPDPARELLVSASTGVAMDHLVYALNNLCFGVPSTSGLTLNVRHVHAVESARAALLRTADADDPELIAAELRESLNALGSILGHITADDVLGVIFSGFCIGK